MFVDYARRLVNVQNPRPRSVRLEAVPDLAVSRAPIRFREYEPRDRATIIDLLAQGRPDEYRPMKEAIFDWQFGKNPDAGSASPFLVGTVDGEVVAINGFMPVRIRYKDIPVHATWSCDTYVSSKFRGRGFGKELIRRVSRNAPVMLGYGISDMSDPILERESWVLNPASRVLFFHVSEPGFRGTLKDLCTQVALRIHGLQRKTLPVEISRHDEDFGPEADELWAQSSPGYLSAVRRDAAYLNWKYRKHPALRYTWYAAREGGNLRALAVARHARNCSVIVDYSGPARDVDLMSALIADATADLAERGTMRVQCETTHAPLLAALEHCGFIRSHYRPRFRVRTNLPGDEHPVHGWFLMPGDSDGDMCPSVS
jgi:GNAT superfamily N-acetyltransferase